MSTKSLRYNDITRNTVANSQIPMPPVITGYSISGLDDTALDPAGGQTLFVNGKGFQKGATVTLNGSAIGVVSWVSANRLSFTAPAYSAGTYQLYVINPDGGTAIYIPGVVYSTFPTWTTPASPSILSTNYETTSINTSVVATGDAPVTYTVIAGSLPSGATMTSGGVITGTAPTDSGSTTYTFTVQADDAQKQSSTRQFSITINTDVVTWVAPSSGATINLDGSAYSQSLSATDAAGYSVSYTANALPTGLTLTSGTISGTPTVEGSTATLLTATAATTNRSATNTITWVVSLSDIYWKYATLLLTANSSIQTNSFVSDASINNNQLTVVGDTRAQNSNPYQPGYYSYQFNGSTDSLTVSTFTALGSGNFTVEAWIYPTGVGTSGIILEYRTSIGSQPTFFIENSSGWRLAVYYNVGYVVNTTGGTITLNAWQHVAWVKNGTTSTLYINGVVSGSASDTLTHNASTLKIGTQYNSTNYFSGNISNLRIVIGSALYTSAFTPSTTPLLPLANTSLLTCQSNKFVDNSANNSALTISGAPKVSSAHPFTTVYQSGTQYYSTSFNGSTDYLTVATDTSLVLGTGDFTIEFWINANAISAEGELIDFRPTGSNGLYPLVYVSSSGVLGWWINSADRITGGTITARTWNHVAVCRFSGSTKMYLNGIQIGSTYNDTNNYLCGKVTVGISTNAYYPFNGYISNLRIVKGQALYTGSFVPPTGSLTTSSVGTSGTNVSASITGTVSLLTCQDSTFKDNSTNNFTITAGTTTVRPTTVHPTVFDPTYYSSSFSGSNYLTLPANSGYDFGTGDFTIEAWINPSALASSRVPISTQLSAGASGWSVFLFSSGYIGFDVYESSTEKTITASTTALTVGTWYHIAITRASGTIRMFVNGVVQTFSGTQASNINSATGLTIGRQQQAGYEYGFNGYISNVRVIKGTAVYTAAFTPSTTPLTAISGTVALTCKSSLIIDESTNVFAITNNSSVVVIAKAPFTQPTGYSASLLPTTYGSGYFDGTGDVVNTPAFAIGTGDFTLEYWTYQGTNTTTNRIFGNLAGGSYVSGKWAIWPYTASGKWAIDIYNVNSGATAMNSTTTMTPNSWYHIALTRSGNVWRLFINGIQEATITNAASLDNGTLSQFTIGGSGYGTESHVGYISDVRFVKTALYTSNFVPQFTSPLSNVTNTQLLTLQTNGSHNNSVFKDQSGFNNIITRNGNVTNGTFSPYGDNWSVYLPGSTSSYYTIPASSVVDFGTGNFTVEFWFNITPGATTNLSYNRAMMYGPSEGNNTNTFGISLQGSSQGSSGILVYHTSNIITYNTAVSQGVWHHIALTRNGTSVLLFLDGVQIGSATSSVNCTNVPINVGALKAATATYDDYFTGYISNLRITKGQALYTSAFTPSTSPLTASSNTSLMSFQSNRIIDNSIKAVSITTNGTPTVQKFSPFSTVTVPKYYSNYFSGADYITTSSSTNLAMGSGDFTIEFWAYYTTQPANGVRLAGNLTTSTWAANMWVFQPNQTNKWNFGWFNGPGLTGSTISSATVNTWYHIAVTRLGNVWSLWVNGTLDATVTSATALDAGAATQVYIGASGPTSDTKYTGYVSNFRIIKGQALYTANFTPSTIPLTAIANTQLLTCQSSTYIDNSSNNFAMTVSAATTKIYAVAPFTPAISTTLLNYSPTTFSGSMYFDGTGDYLTSPYSLGYELTTGDFTIELWVYRMAAGVQHYLIHNRPTSSATGWGTNITASNTINFYFTGAGSLTGTSTVPINTWTHIAFCKSGTTLRIFNNGVLDASSAIGTGTVSTGTNLFIGCDNGPSFAAFFNGYMSDIRISKSALYTSNFYPGSAPLTPSIAVGTTSTASTFLLNGTSAGVIDATRTVALETVGDAKVTNFSPYNGTYYSNYFDGTGDYLTVPGSANLVFNADFTIEFWVFMNNIGPASGDDGWGGASFLVQTNGGTAPTITFNWGITTYRASQNGAIQAFNFWYNTSGSTAGNTAIVGNTVPRVGQWYHIAVTRESNTVRLFVNGALDNTPTSVSGTFGNSSYATYIGAVNYTYARYLNGYISNLRIVKGQALYTGAFTPSASPLETSSIGTSGANVAASLTGTTQLLTCQSNKFKDNSANNFTVTIFADAKVATQNPFQVNTGQSYYFDGTGDYLSAQNSVITSFGSGDFTFEMWFYTVSRTQSYPTLMNNDTAATWGTNFWTIGEGRIDSANKITLWVYNMDTVNPVITSTQNITTGQWYHIAFTRSGTSIKLYINGSLDKTSASQTASLDGGVAKPLYISSAGTSVYNGYITDLRITKGYARTITVPTQPIKTN